MFLSDFPAKITKEKITKNISINHHTENGLDELRRCLEVVDKNYHDFVITYKGMPIAMPAGLKRSFKTACKDAKILCGSKVKTVLFFMTYAVL